MPTLFGYKKSLHEKFMYGFLKFNKIILLISIYKFLDLLSNCDVVTKVNRKVLSILDL